MPKLPVLRIGFSCGEDWSAMRGDGRRRHCAACGRDVVNVATMTPRAVKRMALRAAAGEQVCARITRRDGELVTLDPAPMRVGRVAQQAVLTVAMLAGLPAFAQQSQQDNESVMLKEALPEPEAIPGMAVVIGRLLHPDGSRVDTGLVYAEPAQGYGPTYVVDASGWFELHLKPGTYDFVVRTGADQVERVPAVELHEGVQQFSDLRTRTGQPVPDEIETTMGTVSVTTTTRWGWHAFRHPILYARSLTRRRS
jgi:hypothetical protein